ncbi:hypothetical protein [Castellaniella sp. S9]|uniref:hypothetical protein n=1 Tax=Castellaniella sp. S9 TaxID=2993652 RepID=UPI0022B2EB78|nr:hypothetical protein [Castellaniella sp. S9]
MQPTSSPRILQGALPGLIWRHRLALFCVCLAVFCYGVFRPESPPELFYESDKAMHVLAFMGLGLCAALAACGHRWAWAVWPALIAAAPLVEWLQHALQPATRDFSLGDITGNLIGVALAALVWGLVLRWLKLAANNDTSDS